LDEDLVLQGKAATSSSEDEEEDDGDDEELNEHGVEDEDEENEADLLNLRDEDLQDLEREMEEMRDEKEEGDKEEQQQKPRKTFPKSPVDDKFFRYVNDSDSSTGAADYCYEDFFGSKGSASQKADGKKKNVADAKQSSKKKSVRFAIDEDDAGEGDESEDEAEDEQEMEQGPVLLGEAEQPEEPTTNLKKSLKKLKQTIEKLEQENLAPRSWQLSGEVTAQQREENELLETHVQFDHGMKKGGVVSLFLSIGLLKAFDDVVRKKRIEERTEPYRNQAIEEQEMVKTSLAEVYEKEYQKATNDPNAVNEEHVAIEKRIDELFRLIDALSNFDYTPPEVRPEVRVVSNMAALRVEEVGMSASTDAQLLAPEELKKRQKGDLKADEERDRTDKLRQRRKKKNRQRALVELFGEEKGLENQMKKKKKRLSDDKAAMTAGGEKLKSSTFFTKLQETVRNVGFESRSDVKSSARLWFLAISP
uniref:U3 small nucleolar ribonucleoprotein protein MPP10 n=1 Tax=Heligmosomoides polygyrus TaxID=6339 RepID=A0A8L8K2C7_HELPZ